MTTTEDSSNRVFFTLSFSLPLSFQPFSSYLTSPPLLTPSPFLPIVCPVSLVIPPLDCRHQFTTAITTAITAITTAATTTYTYTHDTTHLPRFVLWYVPETKGKTLEEIEGMLDTSTFSPAQRASGKGQGSYEAVGLLDADENQSGPV